LLFFPPKIEEKKIEEPIFDIGDVSKLDRSFTLQGFKTQLKVC